MVERKWQAEVRGGRVEYEQFELAGITFEDPILLYWEGAADGRPDSLRPSRSSRL
jgi:hypothetical protein